MKIFHAANEVRLEGREAYVAIGFFDGLHLGHQEIISRTLQRARRDSGFALVLTFDPHPAQIVAPERAPRLIYPLSYKQEIIRSCGADGLLLIHFNQTFSEQTGEEFIRSLVGHLGSLRGICVGSNFHFGRQRSGNVELLKTLGGTFGFEVEAVQVVTAEGGNISSTRIRERIRAGDFDSASAMLGRRYALAGKVMRGKGIGRTLGFPTANLEVTGLVLPPQGVYAGTVELDGRVKPAVLNLGLRPTLPQERALLTAEVHIPGIDQQLYDRELRFQVTRKLREEIKFKSLEDLQRQIAKDVALALSSAAEGSSSD